MSDRMSTIETLVEIRMTAAREIAAAPHKVGTLWHADRIADVRYADRVLSRYGIEGETLKRLVETL